MSVLVKQQVMITPSDPTPNHILQLSATDSQIFLHFTAGSFLVYKPPIGVDRPTITHNVKSALARTLVPYYPLAGRLVHRADDLGLEVDCRAQGALFIDAVSTHTSPEFDVAPKRMDPWTEFLSLPAADVLEGAPPLVMQLTWLSDGGAVVALGIDHCLCDGTGYCQFFNSFAQVALGKRVEDLNPKPIWSRHLLGPVSTRNNSLSRHPELRSVVDISGLTSRYSQEELIPTSVIFEQNMLTELNKLTKSETTSFDVLSSHVWRSWARALKLPSNQIVKLVFPVNIRQRVNPNLPSGYYGNAIVFGCAETSVGELTKKGLRYAAELVKRAKERVGDEYVREVVELLSHGANLDSVCTLVMTSWSGLGFNIDFGIGQPVHKGSVRSSTYCRLLPVKTSFKVNLAVLSSAVDAYLYFMKNIYAKM